MRSPCVQRLVLAILPLLPAIVLAQPAAPPAAAKPPAEAGVPGAAAKAADPKAAFEAVSAEMKEIVGELAVLEAKYQQPGADKPAIEASFRELVTRGRAVGRRLEEAALAAAAVDPKNADAVGICGAVAANALQGDNPTRALAVVSQLADGGVADPAIMLIGASAAILLTQPEEAERWLARAEEAGAPAEQIDQTRGKIARDVEKLAPEIAKRAAEAEADDLPRVKISTSAGDIVVELFENEAPNTVANFISLVAKGFYDGTPFHRVIGGFMAQGGDPTGTGSGGPGYAIECECGGPASRKHFLGTLSMAHAGPNTGGSQFFLTFRPTEHLDGKHTVFGRVIEGLDVLPKIVRTQDDEGRPVPGVKPSTIEKAEVIRKRDHAYEPATLPDPRGR
jgi:cyclophilin family peptidyl-prolyl cis-trans isomerase